MRRLGLLLFVMLIVSSWAAQNVCNKTTRPKCKKAGGRCMTINECRESYGGRGDWKDGKKYCKKPSKCGCCIPPPDGCIIEGTFYASGTVFYKNCMKFSCEKNKLISSNQYNALCKPCSALNDPHFTTFDGLLFDWHGHYTYVLSQVHCDRCPDIFVYISLDDCSPGYPSITCVYTVYFQPVPGTKIKIEKASPLISSPITIDGHVQTLIGVVLGDLIVLKGAAGVEHPAVAWMHGGCIHVMGFNDQGYLVKICSGGTTVFAYFTMQNNLCGLCGNFDGNKYNDLRFRSGTIEPPPNQIGTSYSDRIVDPAYGIDWEIQDCDGHGIMKTPRQPTCNENPCFKDGALQLYYITCYRPIDRLRGPQKFFYDCMFDQCIATQTGHIGLPGKWLHQTEMLIKEYNQEKKDTVIYHEDPKCEPILCKGGQGICSLDPIDGFKNVGLMECKTVGCNCWIPEMCVPRCWHGVCTAPNTCSCYRGWTGRRCEIQIECEPPCVNGYCTATDTCTCYEDWKGPRCDICICSGSCTINDQLGYCYPGKICPPKSSSNTDLRLMSIQPVVSDPVTRGPQHGTCAKVCTCCPIILCLPSRSHIRCTNPDNCNCDSGWTGNQCQTPICSPKCVHGDCTSPNVCNCLSGWTGNHCQTREIEDEAKKTQP